MELAELSREIVTILRGDTGISSRNTVERALQHFKPVTVSAWEFGEGNERRSVKVERTVYPVPAETLHELSMLGGVSVQRNVPLTRAFVPQDALFAEQWALRQMGADVAWECLKTVPVTRITIAIVDSGVARHHPDLHGRTHPRSKRFVVNPPDHHIDDEDGHGTSLAGTVAAVTDNPIGVASATWPFIVRVLAQKFYDPWNELTGERAARAIVDAVDEGARVINLSWHVGLESAVLYDAIEYADLHDVLVVAAAGNEGTNNDELSIWPASYSDPAYGLTNVVSVMATNRHDDKPGYSNYGRRTVDLAAPGQGILSTHYYLEVPQYREYAGTSAAAAHVTAAATLVRALRPAWTAPQVKQYLRTVVDANPFLDCVARGRLNLARAVCPLV
jgi:thermitase